MKYLAYILFFFCMSLNAQFALLNNFSNNDTIDGWPEEYFQVIHKVDFEDNTIGLYSNYQSEWEDDWGESYGAGRDLEDTEIVSDGSTKCMETYYPLGSVNGVNQGCDFVVNIPGTDADSIELYLSYDVKYEAGFDFVLSGKFGAYMHVGDDWAGEHGGGPNFDEGGRYGVSWTDESGWLGVGNGSARFYFYHHGFSAPVGGETRLWYSDNTTYSYFIFFTSPEKWYNVTMRMVVNTVESPPDSGNNDGFAEAFINGQYVGRWDSLRMRNVDSIGLNQLTVYSQFGGIDSATFAARDDEWMQLDNLHVWLYSPGVSVVPKLYTKSDSSRFLKIPETWSNATLQYE